MTPPRMRERNYAAEARARLEQYYDNLKRSRKTALLVAVIKRFVEIDGFTLSGLVSIQLFTSVIPLIIIGFAYFSGFASNASVGDLFIRDLGLHHPFDVRVREAFGTPSGVQYVWTFLGLGAFLVWGIPMSIKVAAIFAQAWRRQQFGMAKKLSRSCLVRPVPGNYDRPRAHRVHRPTRSRSPCGASGCIAGSGVDLLVAHPNVARARRWSRLEIPPARWLRRGRDRRNCHHRGCPGGLPDIAPGVDRVRPDGRRDDLDDLVRGYCDRLDSNRVHERDYMGTNRPRRNPHSSRSIRSLIIESPTVRQYALVRKYQAKGVHAPGRGA